MGASGTPPEADPPDRRGWRLPDDAASGGVPGFAAADAERYEPPQQRPSAQPPQGMSLPQGMSPSQGMSPPQPTTTLPQSVAGLARAVNVASVQGGNGTQSTVVTFRLEQYDARAGRTGVVTVRMFGDNAIGFVSEGDWVEVAGKTKHGFIKASRAVNHTSHAQYSATGQGCAKVVGIVAFCLILIFILVIGASILFSVLGGG